MRRIPAWTLFLLLLAPAGAWADIPPVPPDREPPTATPAPETPTPAAEPELTPRPIPTDLGARVDEAILLLANDNFAGFIESFAPPRVLAELRAQGAMEEILRDAAEHPEKISALNALLREARAEEVLMNADGTVAILETKTYVELGEDAVVFQKVDGVWYIAD